MSFAAYGKLLQQHPRFASFGLLVAFVSSFGQTYLVGIFGHAMQQDFAMSHTQWGGIYMLGTLASALLLPWTGKWIDQVSLPKYTLWVMLSLVFATWFVSQIELIWWLVLAVFFLRQSGQGLMSHVAYTAMGRYFDKDRGKATSLVAMGFALGEAILPMLAVMAIALWGWRHSFQLASMLILVVFIPLAMWLLRGHGQRHADYEMHLAEQERRAAHGLDTDSKAAAQSFSRRDVLRDYRFYLLVPGLAAISLVSTAMFFHHLNLADEKGWSHGFLTATYAYYSVLVIVAAVITGQLIDRFNAKVLVPYTLLPMSLALLLIYLIDASWVIWPYMTLLGIGNGFAQTAQSSIWAECYGVRHLGAIKSVFWTLVVFASAIGPVWLGSLVDMGWLLQEAVMTMVVYLLGASVMLWVGVRSFKATSA
jgi:MFS family permease